MKTRPRTGGQLLAGLGVFLLSVAICGRAEAQTARQVAQNSFPSVVLLVMEDANGQPVSLGSGFFVRENVIASNFHVIEGASRGYAKLVGKKTKYDIAGIVGMDASRDLALLAVSDAKAPALSVGDSRRVAVGDEIYAVGNPQGLEGTFSQGIVSSIREVESETLLQITAPISPGSSGGPVLNSEGKVVGVAVATFKGGQNLNFAIPAKYLEELLQKEGKPQPLSQKTAKVGKSILDALGGGKSTEGVTGGTFTYDSPSGNQDGQFSLSLANHLREPVKNVYCLLVFHDTTGNPIDVSIVKYSGVIPAGLAKRVTGRVDGSVEKLNRPISYPASMSELGPPRSPKGRIEFRVLNFELTE